MAISGIGSQQVFAQSYKSLFVGNPPKNNFVGDFLAPDDGLTKYVNGLLVAQIATGDAENIGKWGYYRSDATNGLQIPVGIIWDEFLDESKVLTAGESLLDVNICTLSGGLIMREQSFLVALSADRTPELITSLGGKVIKQGGVVLIVFN